MAVLLCGLLVLGCGADPTDSLPATQRLSGEAMGTYYRITYLGEEITGLEGSIDSLLAAFNLELSLWEDSSRISAFNRSARGVDLAGTRHFLPNLELAARVVERTEGAYDPTVGPLVDYWGFGRGERRATDVVDTAEVRRVLAAVGFDKLSYTADSLLKSRPDVRLDLNASAKGYGVDLIANLLTSRGRPDYLIDVGGEFRSGGTKNGQPWRVAIRLPEEDAARVAAAGTLPLANGRAIATSGNYLSYYRVGGATFSHTIDPRTGLVERNRLLSASVLADDCATADAYATACMVLGPEGALALVRSDPKLEGYFLVRGEDGELAVISTLERKD